jgi:rhodanese-related sulfurtransferase
MNLVAFITQEWLLVISLVVLILFFIYREFTRGGPRLSVHELTRAVNSDSAIILDVRNSNEFNAGHIVDAINIPYNKMESDLGQLDKHREKQIVIVDKMGQHAGAVSQRLTAKGFVVARLRGGIAEWQQQNLPLVK